MPEQHLLDDQACLDRLAEPDIVGDQKIGPRHIDGAHQRIELKILDADAATERGLKEAAVRVRCRTPADGVQECFEFSRIVLTGDGRQPGFFDDVCARLDLPNNFELFSQCIFIYR